MIWNKQKQKWEAYIRFRGQHYHLGLYKNKDDAAKSRARAESMHDDFLEWYNTVFVVLPSIKDGEVVNVCFAAHTQPTCPE